VSTPEWFTAALAQRPQLLHHESGGVRIAYRAWGGRGQPLIVLVHGGTAHGAWWDFVGPLLAARHRVVAPDLSGHGDSGHRQAYGLAPWAEEVAALVAREGDGAPPVVVGHSMGGWVSLMLASAHPEVAGELVVVDSPMRPPGPDVETLRRRAHRTPRVYETRAEALSHFRLTPSQDRAVLPYAFDHVASTSIREVEGGWTWKFDPQVFGRRTAARPDLATVVCPVTLLAAERGMLAVEDAGRAAAVMAGPVTIAQLPDAGHHVMVDQPLALVTALRLVLGRAAAT
jgi:pimeloyl-ACP methyl ester carboxylesterase